MEMYFLDMAELSVTTDGTNGRVCGPSGELIAHFVHDDDLDDREVFLRACDAALATGKVQRVRPDGALHKVAVGLYNPYTYELAVQPLPNTRAYGDDQPVVIPTGGLCGDAQPGHVTIAGRNLNRLEPDRQRFARAQHAHRS